MVDDNHKLQQISNNNEQTRQKIGQRKQQGAYYTPIQTATKLAQLTITEWAKNKTPQQQQNATIFDPACGTGNLLAPAAQTLAEHTQQPLQTIIENNIYGADINETAVRDCKTSLQIITAHTTQPNIIQANTLDQPSTGTLLQESTPLETHFNTNQFDIIIANPPFLSQFRKATKTDTQQLQQQYGDLITSRTDIASIFVLAAYNYLKPDGMMCIIQPMSFLTAEASQNIRKFLTQKMRVTHVWVCDSPELFFDAKVNTITIIAHKTENTKNTTTRILNTNFTQTNSTQLSSNNETWATLHAKNMRIPNPQISSTKTLRTHITKIWTDYRNDYYDLQNNIIDNKTVQKPKLLTTKHINIAQNKWGTTKTTIHKQLYSYPKIFVDNLPPKTLQRIQQTCQPKIVVSQQTRITECYYDETGEHYPTTPLVNIITPQPWYVAAIICCAPVCCWILHQRVSSGRASYQIRLPIESIKNIPLPENPEPMKNAATKYQQAQKTDNINTKIVLLTEMSEYACQAYNIKNTKQIMKWWTVQLKKHYQQ